MIVSKPSRADGATCSSWTQYGLTGSAFLCWQPSVRTFGIIQKISSFERLKIVITFPVWCHNHKLLSVLHRPNGLKSPPWLLYTFLFTNYPVWSWRWNHSKTFHCPPKWALSHLLVKCQLSRLFHICSPVIVIKPDILRKCMAAKNQFFKTLELYDNQERLHKNTIMNYFILAEA